MDCANYQVYFGRYNYNWSGADYEILMSSVRGKFYVQIEFILSSSSSLGEAYAWYIQHNCHEQESRLSLSLEPPISLFNSILVQR